MSWIAIKEKISSRTPQDYFDTAENRPRHIHGESG